MTTPSPRKGRLDGLHVFITGASRGIGRAIAIAMAEEGARLTLAATNQALLDEAVVECLPGAEGAHRTRVLNVTDRAACFAAISEAEAEAGSIDVLVNGAGIYSSFSFFDYTEDEFRRIMEVNLYGSLHLMQAALPQMIDRGWGRVINVASAAGKWASPNQAAYNVSKHALIGLTRCVAQEIGESGVTVNAICPGMVETDMLTSDYRRLEAVRDAPLETVIAPVLARVAMKRVLRPPEIATLSVFLASTESSGMTGQSLVVDGGMLFV